MDEVVLSKETLAILDGFPGCSLDLKVLESGNGLLDSVDVDRSLVNWQEESAILNAQLERSAKLVEDELSRKAAEAYIPGPVRSALQEGGGGPRSVDGLRKVSVIFIKLYDVVMPKMFDASNVDAFLEATQHQAKLVQESAYHYWATLRQFILDDKGFVAIVVVGLPPLFHEDNANRAIKVRLELLFSGILDTTLCLGLV